MRTTIAHGKSRYQQKDSTLWGLASTWEMRLTGPIPRPERTLTINAANALRKHSRGPEESALAGEMKERMVILGALGSDLVATRRVQADSLARLRAEADATEARFDARAAALSDEAGTVATAGLFAIRMVQESLRAWRAQHEARAASGNGAGRQPTELTRRLDEILQGRRVLSSGGAPPPWLTQTQAELSKLDEQSAQLLSFLAREREIATAFREQEIRIHDMLFNDLSPGLGLDWAFASNAISTILRTPALFLLIMIGCGALIGAAVGLVLIRGIVRPMQTLMRQARRLADGDDIGAIEIENDDEIGELARSFNRVIERHQASEEALKDLASFDSLTRLPNRDLFNQRLGEAMDNARQIGRSVAIHVVDIDNFKEVNDSLGIPAGDEMLRQVSLRLLDCVRGTDLVARMGADEFAIIQTNLVEEDGTVTIAERVVESLAEPFQIVNNSLFTGVSIGIALYHGDDSAPEDVLKNAHLAMQRAKSGGRGTYQLYDPQINADIVARRQLEADIRNSLTANNFYLKYQPRVQIAEGTIAAAEALIRWNHPERGEVSPAEFIPVAEHSGLIQRITEFVLIEACEQIKTWREEGMPPITISINLSPVDFRRPDLLNLINDVLTSTEVDPSQLELEITEGMMMHEVDEIVERLEELRRRGLSLAIDDFGTGYSSMSYLKRFPVDILKIDQSFMSGIPQHREDVSITMAIIRMAHSLGLRVVAEGVETEEQLDFLRRRNCDEAQGYLFSRPLGADEFAAFIRDRLLAEAK